MPKYLWYIFAALILYTWAVWGAQRNQKSIPLRFIFLLAFVFDLIGTYRMYLLRTTLDIHGFIGFSALIIMAVHAAWALGSIRYKHLEKLFHRWSLYAWSLWMLTFFTGAAFHS